MSEAVAAGIAPAPAEWAAGLGVARLEGEPESLRALRARSLESFAARGLPRPHEEEWRFTNVGPVARTRFVRPSAGAGPDGPGRALESARLAGCHEVVFVDGRFAPELSGSAAPPPGVSVRALSRAAQDGWPEAGAELGRRADVVSRPFAALATALFEDGAVIEIEPGATVEAPIHLVFWQSAQALPSAVFPRVLVRAGANSRL